MTSNGRKRGAITPAHTPTCAHGMVVLLKTEERTVSHGSDGSPLLYCGFRTHFAGKRLYSTVVALLYTRYKKRGIPATTSSLFSTWIQNGSGCQGQRMRRCTAPKPPQFTTSSHEMLCFCIPRNHSKKCQKHLVRGWLRG